MAVPAHAPSVTPNADAIKVVLAARLASAKLTSASDAIHDSEARLVEDELQFHTELSKTMLPVVINPEAERVMREALRENRLSGLRITLVPGKSRLPAAPSTTSGTSVGVSVSFAQLSNTAVKLNTISDQLCSQVEKIDTALKRLNLGVSAWLEIRNDRDEDGNWWVEELGYARVGNKWGVALKTSSGFFGDPSEPDIDLWAFADAPRHLRIKAVGRIGELIDCLRTEADKMIEQLEPKVQDLTNITAALDSLGGARP